VLGCTHYPLIKSVLRSVAPWRVEIVDSAESTTAVVCKHFGRDGEQSAEAPSGNVSYFVTDSVEKFRRLGAVFMGRAVAEVKHVDIGG
jgi:glutamate racemase